jgi:hypothetical protein
LPYFLRLRRSRIRNGVDCTFMGVMGSMVIFQLQLVVSALIGYS